MYLLADLKFVRSLIYKESTGHTYLNSLLIKYVIVCNCVSGISRPFLSLPAQIHMSGTGELDIFGRFFFWYEQTE